MTNVPDAMRYPIVGFLTIVFGTGGFLISVIAPLPQFFFPSLRCKMPAMIQVSASRYRLGSPSRRSSRSAQRKANRSCRLSQIALPQDKYGAPNAETDCETRNATFEDLDSVPPSPSSKRFSVNPTKWLPRRDRKSFDASRRTLSRSSTFQSFSSGSVGDNESCDDTNGEGDGSKSLMRRTLTRSATMIPATRKFASATMKSINNNAVQPAASKTKNFASSTIRTVSNTTVLPASKALVSSMKSINSNAVLPATTATKNMASSTMRSISNNPAANATKNLATSTMRSISNNTATNATKSFASSTMRTISTTRLPSSLRKPSTCSQRGDGAEFGTDSSDSGDAAARKVSKQGRRVRWSLGETYGAWNGSRHLVNDESDFKERRPRNIRYFSH